MCRYTGKSKTKVKGSFLLEVFLWLFFLLPGIIYTFWRHTTKQKVCPRCGHAAMIPVDTPKGQELMGVAIVDSKQVKA